MVKCNYGDLTDDMLRDAFIEGCMSDPLREKLIMTDRLTLPHLELAAAHGRSLQRKALLQGTSIFHGVSSSSGGHVRWTSEQRSSKEEKRSEAAVHHISQQVGDLGLVRLAVSRATGLRIRLVGPSFSDVGSVEQWGTLASVL